MSDYGLCQYNRLFAGIPGLIEYKGGSHGLPVQFNPHTNQTS